MADFHLNHGSQHMGIATNGQKIIVPEQLIDYSDEKRKRQSENPILYIGGKEHPQTRSLFVHIPVHPGTDHHHGCAFVDMRNSEQTLDAIAPLSGLIFFGRKITVQIARSDLSTYAASDEVDEEPPAKKLKHDSDQERNYDDYTAANLKFEEHSRSSSPQLGMLSSLTMERFSVEDLGLEFVQLWVDEYADADSGRTKRTKCLAGLLLQLDVSESKLHEQISRILMQRAASREKELAEAPRVRVPRSENIADKLEQYHWKELRATFMLEHIPLPVGVIHRSVRCSVTLSENIQSIAASDLSRGLRGGNRIMRETIVTDEENGVNQRPITKGAPGRTIRY